MVATLLLIAFAATTANAAGRLGAAQPGTLTMAPRGGFNLPNGDINGLALVQALTDTLMRYNSTPITKPYNPTPEEQAEETAVRGNALLNPSLNGSVTRREFTEPLSSNQDIDYDGYISIGTGLPTRFLMQFDTGKRRHPQSHRSKLTQPRLPKHHRPRPKMHPRQRLSPHSPLPRPRHPPRHVRHPHLQRRHSNRLRMERHRNHSLHPHPLPNPRQPRLSKHVQPLLLRRRLRHVLLRRRNRQLHHLLRNLPRPKPHRQSRILLLPRPRIQLHRRIQHPHPRRPQHLSLLRTPHLRPRRRRNSLVGSTRRHNHRRRLRRPHNQRPSRRRHRHKFRRRPLTSPNSNLRSNPRLRRYSALRPRRLGLPTLRLPLQYPRHLHPLYNHVRQSLSHPFARF